MKIKGKTIPPPEPVTVKIPRGDQIIEFVCGPVLDFSEFERLCPEPKAPLVTEVGKGSYRDTKAPVYLAALEKHRDQRTNWLMLKSLSATKDLEWETVNMDDPTTWENFRKELRECFTDAETVHVINSIMDANYPSEERLKEAIKNLQPPHTEAENSDTSQKEEQDSTQSTEPVNV